MKTLTTEQQSELQSLLESLNGLNIDVQQEVNYWVNELKPKRIRKKTLNNEVSDQLELIEG